MESRTLIFHNFKFCISTKENNLSDFRFLLNSKNNKKTKVKTIELVKQSK